jgi:hypothetical protein
MLQLGRLQLSNAVSKLFDALRAVRLRRACGFDFVKPVWHHLPGGIQPAKP